MSRRLDYTQIAPVGVKARVTFPSYRSPKRSRRCEVFAF